MVKVLSCYQSHHSVADLGWFPGFNGTPLSCMKVLIILYYDKLTRSVGPVDYMVLMEPPPCEQQNYSDCGSLWSEFWSPRAQRRLRTHHNTSSSWRLYQHSATKYVRSGTCLLVLLSDSSRSSQPAQGENLCGLPTIADSIRFVHGMDRHLSYSDGV